MRTLIILLSFAISQIVNGQYTTSIRAMLHGPYDPITGLMKDDLRLAGLIPLTEPYTALGFVHAGGGGGETISPTMLTVSGNNAIVDWVFIEIAPVPDYTAPPFESKSCLIQRDGDVVDVNGNTVLTFNSLPFSYPLKIRHRNHLGLATVNQYGSGQMIDFTIPQGSPGYIYTYPQAPGQDPPRILVGSVYCMWEGEVFWDDEVKYTGTNNDRDRILTRIGGTVPTNTVSGYWKEDVNMDGLVKYTGAKNDRDPILVNIGGVNPTDVLSGGMP